MKTLLAALILALAPQDAVVKAEKALEKNPDDPAANLTLGAHYADHANWEKAIPCLGKVKNAEIRAAVEAEKDGTKSVEIGDLWAKALGKAGGLRQACFDRMNVHYAAAWESLNAAAKAKLKERLLKLYTHAQQGKSSELTGWGGVQGAAGRVEVMAQRVQSGTCALKVSPKDLTRTTGLQSKSLPVQVGKKLEVSCWVLTDGTNTASDSIKFVIRDARDGFTWTTGQAFKADLPVWVRVGGETVVPDGSLGIEVQLMFASTTGALYVDGLSIRMDGKELATWFQ